MKPTVKFWSLLSACIFFLHCSNIEKKEGLDVSSLVTTPLNHAKCFSILETDNITLIENHLPGNEKDVVQRIVLTSDNTQYLNADIVLNKKIERVVLISTTYIPFILELDEIKTIVGVSNASLIYSDAIKEKLSSGQIIDIGGDHNLNYERIVALNPDIVFMYDFGSSTSSVQQKLESFGLNVVLVSEFRELTPLGKSEWIKFFGALFNKRKLAKQKFSKIEGMYQETLSYLDSIDYRPSIFTGLPWKGQWYQPGGSSFQAKYFKDAGADYLWESDTNTSGIRVDREVVFEKGLNADFWLHPSNVRTKSEIADQDERYRHFEAFKTNRIFNNNLRLNDDMGNDYWESAIVNPHLVLKDLMAIFHPDLFPDYELYYYRKVE